MKSMTNFEDPQEKDWQLKQDICSYLRNPLNIQREKDLTRLQINNYTLRLKKLYKDKPEQWKEIKDIWKKIIDFYKEKGMV